MKSITLTLLLVLCLGLSSCQETCGIIAEPTLSLNFVNMATPNFKNIKMLGVVKDLPNSGTAVSSPGGSMAIFFCRLTSMPKARPTFLNNQVTDFVYVKSISTRQHAPHQSRGFRRFAGATTCRHLPTQCSESHYCRAEYLFNNEGDGQIGSAFGWLCQCQTK